MSIAANARGLPVEPEDQADTGRTEVDEAPDQEDGSLAVEPTIAINCDEDDIADQFDDFRGRGAWPGACADDAESSDFEDSLGEIADGNYEDDDRE